MIISKNKNNIIPFFMMVFLFSACSVMKVDKSENRILSYSDDFNNRIRFHIRWKNDSQNSPKSYRLSKGNLEISTREQSLDRVKVKSKKDIFGAGIYKWRIFVPAMGLYEQCSIGAFLYHSGDINYEIDFEIGSGTKAHRDQVDAKDHEVLVHCTTQIAPYDNEIFTIEAMKYYDFSIELMNGANNCYLVKWFIDDELVKTLQTNISTEITFSIHNSLENLSFMGDQLPSIENYVLFDRFEFIGE